MAQLKVELLETMRLAGGDILDYIATKKALDDKVKLDLDKFLKDFIRKFLG